MLDVKRDLVGKTISGIIAAPAPESSDAADENSGASEIWLLQFSDGTHVEFVSPGARQGLRKWARKRSAQTRANDPQLLLNVA